MRTLAIIAIVCLVLFAARPAQAQPLPGVPLPTSYRLTRTLPAPVSTTTFLAASMACGLARGGVSSPPGLRIEDPSNAAVDCELLGNASGVIVARQAANAYSMVACDSNGDCSSPGTFNLALPTVPANPRLRLPPPAVAFDATVTDRYRLGQIDVATTIIDGLSQPFYFGAATLTIPGYSVQRGDKVSVALWRP